jgi:hypothetical protein
MIYTDSNRNEYQKPAHKALNLTATFLPID